MSLSRATAGIASKDLLSGGAAVTGGLFAYNGLLALEPSLLALISYAGHDMMLDLMVDGGGAVMPLSPFNILFAANAIAALAALAVFWPMGLLKNIGRTPWRQWGWLAGGILTSNVACTALLTWALFLVPVINVVLIAALHVPIGGLAAWLIFGEKPSRRQAWAYVLIFTAAVVPLLLDDDISLASLLEKGDLIALAAVSLRVGGQFLNKQASFLPVAISLTVANCVSAVVFFFLAGAFFHPAHVLDAFDSRALYLIALYALLVLNGKRLTKYLTFRYASRLAIISSSAAQPVMAMVIAAILTHHQPTPAHMIGGALVIIGILAASESSYKFGGKRVRTGAAL